MKQSKILIVDDEEEILHLVKKSLEAHGYEVDTLSDPTQFLSKTAEFEPDLILMDIVLPNTDGAELVKSLQARPNMRDIPVIFLSGIVNTYEESDNISNITVANKEYPAIAKPFTAQKLIEAIQKL